MPGGTQLCHKTQKCGQTWTDTFPDQMTTEQESVRFVKKLLAIAISNISYLRSIFPEKAFGERCVDDLNLKILKNDASFKGASQVIVWLKGVFDAIDKKYLRMMTIGIYRDPLDANTLIEAYTFRFSYTDGTSMEIYRDNKKIADKSSTEETKKATIHLMRTLLVLMQTLEPLPNQFNITMKLHYYDDVTPPEYEPPGFKAAQSDSFEFEKETIKIKVGNVDTPFHSMRLRLITDATQFNMKEGDGGATEGQDSVEVSRIMSELSQQHVIESGLDVAPKQERVEEEISEHILTQQQQQQLKAAVAGSQQGSPTSVNESEQVDEKRDSQVEDQGVRCSCGFNENDGLMLMCSSCKYWQHGACFKVFDQCRAPLIHMCFVCTQKGTGDLPPTDPSLVGMKAAAVQKLCLWRRILLAVSQEAEDAELSVSLEDIMQRLGTTKKLAKSIVTRLEAEGCLNPPSPHRSQSAAGHLPRNYSINVEQVCSKAKYLANLDNNPRDELSVQASRLELTEDKNKAVISEGTLKKKADKKKQNKSKPVEKSSTQNNIKNKQQTKAGVKRQQVILASSKQEFEESNTQETADDFELTSGRQNKKSKSSVAEKPIRK